MTLRHYLSVATLSVALVSAGCKGAPGKPTTEGDAKRPDQVLDFPTLYAENCASCHGVQGKNGAAISLANPVYLSVAGVANIQHVTSVGVKGTAMPPFAQSAGGLLTDQQIAVLSQGMVSASGGSASSSGGPGYTATTPGNAEQGQTVFVTSCARCHGADGSGVSSQTAHIGSVVDPAYLSLISDQGLRSIVIAGMPDQGMPGWQSGSKPLTDAEITNVVAWLGSHRIAAPGQPYHQNVQP
jgi:mono/diheme cytochrome c family protein